MREASQRMFNSFDQVATSPFIWWMQARSLMLAAYAVRDAHKESFEAYWGSMPKEDGPVRLSEEQAFHLARIGIGPVFPLLMGLALENMVKGILVARDSSLVSGGKLSRDLTGSHDLLALFNKVGLELSAEDRDLLRRLGECVLWAGRYPVPKSEDGRTRRPIPGRRGLFEPGTVLPEEEVRITDLWEKLNKVIASDPRCPKYRSWSPEDDDAHNTVGQADG
jgi:hypothetical protein